MTLAAIVTLGVVVALALLLLVIRHARDSARRQDTWVCLVCRAGFSSEGAADAHVINAHRQP